jgi:hypothetical protein
MAALSDEIGTVKFVHARSGANMMVERFVAIGETED